MDKLTRTLLRNAVLTGVRGVTLATAWMVAGVFVIACIRTPELSATVALALAKITLGYIPMLFGFAVLLQIVLVASMVVRTWWKLRRLGMSYGVFLSSPIEERKRILAQID